MQPEGPEGLRRKALIGQLLLVATGVGICVGGVVVSAVGLTDVFVDADLAYLGIGPDALREANPRLPAFIAHDRAGFGGALISAGAAITLLSMWGWRRGDAWVWWTLALAALAGFTPALATHGGIGYTDPGHLAPVYAGIALTVAGLILSWPYLCATATPGAQCALRTRSATPRCTGLNAVCGHLFFGSSHNGSHWPAAGWTRSPSTSASRSSVRANGPRDGAACQDPPSR